MTELFEPAFLERQQAVYPELDVRVYAAAVREMHGRRPVRNPNGLLVHWLRRAENARRARRAESDAAAQAATDAEMDRYATLWVALLAFTASCGLSPGEVARALEAAREGGFPKLNARIAEQLRRIGQGWPDWSHAMPGRWKSAGAGRARSHTEV